MLLDKAYEECPRLLYAAIKKIRDKNIKVIKQNSIHPLGFYCTQRKKGDENINWNQSSRNIFNFIRAICLPGPQARSYIGNQEIFINRAEYIKDAPIYKGIPGAVLSISNGELLVKTMDSFIKIIDWRCGSKIRVGSRLK